MQTKQYIPLKEQASWIRAALREEFPGCKFSVRSASGGAVTIRWTDGPTSASVKSVTRRFELEGFDGMTDMRYDIPLEVGGREVYGGGLILEQRDISDEWEAEILAELGTLAGCEILPNYWEQQIPVSVNRQSGEVYRMVDYQTEYVSELLHRYTVTRSR